MNAATSIARRFEDIAERLRGTTGPSNLPRADQIVYYVVAIRCEIDINGFDSVLDQLLDETELDFFCSALTEVGETSLAATWLKIATLLRGAGHWPKGTATVSNLPQPVRQELVALANAACKGDKLWAFDDKLAAL